MLQITGLGLSDKASRCLDSKPNSVNRKMKYGCLYSLFKPISLYNFLCIKLPWWQIWRCKYLVARPRQSCYYWNHLNQLGDILQMYVYDHPGLSEVSARYHELEFHNLALGVLYADLFRHYSLKMAQPNLWKWKYSELFEMMKLVNGLNHYMSKANE